MKTLKLFRQHLVIAAFALSLITTAFTPAQPVEAAAKKPAQVKITKIKNVNPSKTPVKISWKKSKGAKSYQVSIATDKKFKKGRKTYNTKALSKNTGNLKVGQKYYVRVRAKAKKWGKWSSVKTFRASVVMAKTKKPAANNKNNDGQQMTPQTTKPSKPAGCQHSWEFSANLQSTATTQRSISGCGKDITDFHIKVRTLGPQKKTINGRTYTYTARTFDEWGEVWFGTDDDIPCPCEDCPQKGWCGGANLVSSSTIDQLGDPNHTKATCKYCGEVRLSGDPDFPSGYTTYE